MNMQNTAVLRIAFLFSIVCGLCWNLQTKASESSPGEINASKILVLGDSISAGYGMPLEKGWVNLLEIFLQENHPGWTTINASVSGETTSGGLARFPDLLDAPRYCPDLPDGRCYFPDLPIPPCYFPGHPDPS